MAFPTLRSPWAVHQGQFSSSPILVGRGPAVYCGSPRHTLNLTPEVGADQVLRHLEAPLICTLGVVGAVRHVAPARATLKTP